MSMDVRSGVPEPPAGIAMNFDAGFVTRLQRRDPETCAFLVSSLTPVLDARLRYKLRDQNDIEDIRNETFYRVFCLVDGGRVRQPEQFGSFVRGVCDRVAQESRRKVCGTEPLAGLRMDPRDRQPRVDEVLADSERKALVWRAVAKLGEADRRLILELACEERDRCDLARERGLSAIGLNVRLCRAMKRLRAQLSAQPAAPPVCRLRTRRIRRASRSTNRWATMAA
jgi:RNA polymerase sigma-70 factor (ECF subfamily)